MDKKNLKFSVGAVAHNDKAPRDKASRWYKVTSAGVCDWLSSGPTTVAVDDMIYVSYSGGSIYKYTHHPSPMANLASKEEVADLMPLLALMETAAYGLRVNIATGVVQRWGNSALHATLPIQNRMRGCLLSDDGVPTYIPEDDWTEVDRTGVSGQVMVEVPDCYFRCWTDGVYVYIMSSEYPLSGFTYLPKAYAGAYEATMDRGAEKLCSVVNTGANYRGGDNTSVWDETHRDLLGRPATNLNRIEFTAAANNRGKGWCQIPYHVYIRIVWLMCIEYGQLNMQDDFDASLDVNGYKKGALGAGVTNIDNTMWTSWNSRNPFIPCGYTDSFGNRSGEKAFVLPAGYSATTLTTYANRYRGIELPFGHTWKWLEGVNVDIKTDGDGGTSKVYVCEDITKFANTITEDYEYRADIPRVSNYVKEILFGPHGDIFPTAVHSTSSGYFYDYFYTGVASSSVRGVYAGGSASYSSSAGPFYLRTYYTPSARSASIGSRLCFIPKTNTPLRYGED